MVEKLPEKLKAKIEALGKPFMDSMNALKEQYKNVNPEWDDSWAFSNPKVTDDICDPIYEDNGKLVIEAHEPKDDTPALKQFRKECNAFISKKNKLYTKYELKLEKILFRTGYRLETDECYNILNSKGQMVASFYGGQEKIG